MNPSELLWWPVLFPPTTKQFATLPKRPNTSPGPRLGQPSHGRTNGRASYEPIADDEE
jgi:hypothetical protein